MDVGRGKCIFKAKWSTILKRLKRMEETRETNLLIYDKN